jgi:hypothetical protein
MPPSPNGGGSAPDTPPAFADDPLAWLDWLDRATIGDPEPIQRASHPAAWVDGMGRGWRVVTTQEGPEVRPTLDNQPVPRTDLPLITTLLVTPVSVRVELCSRHARQLETLPRGRHALVDLGKAMFTSSELPHEGLDRMDSDAFLLARRRWDQGPGPGTSHEAAAAAPGRRTT